MDAEKINERAYAAQMKISMCGRLFAITYKNPYLSKTDDKIIKNKIGEIRKNINFELNFYQELQRKMVSKQPLEINYLCLNAILDYQKILINDLIMFLNKCDLTPGYKRNMLNIIRTSLLEPVDARTDEEPDNNNGFNDLKRSRRKNFND